MPERLARHCGSAVCRKQRVGLSLSYQHRTSFAKVFGQPVGSLLPNRYQPLFVALTDDTDYAGLLSELRECQRHELGNTESSSIKSLKHGTVA